MKRIRFLVVLAVFVIVLALQTIPAQAWVYNRSGWTPIYVGIDYAEGYVTSPRLMRAFALRIDLQNPSVHMYASHDNGGSPYEVALQGTDAFITDHGLRVACNGAFFNPNLSPNTDIWGLLASNGTIVSPPDYAAPFNSYISFTSSQVPTIAVGNSVPAGCYNAIGGAEVILSQGANVAWDSDPQPATSFGISQDNRYMIMVAVDGRQPGWSDGATPANMAQWMVRLGAWNALKMDGGGSTCIARQDIGVCNHPCYGYVRPIGASLGAFSNLFTNPPFLFSNDAQSWTAGGNTSTVWWTSLWGAAIYWDQLANDCWIQSQNVGFTPPYEPSCINVDVYPQNGNSASHDMRAFWQTTAEPNWDSNKSSNLVSYTAQNTWATLNLGINNDKWKSQSVNKLRLDFDTTNHNTRFIVNNVVRQNALWYHFAYNTMGWTAISSLSAPYQESCCGWPGVLVTDQTGNDAFMRVSIPINGDYPFHYIGGRNDKIHVRVYPQNGNTANHDMAVYWTHESDGAESESKSVHVNFTGQNQWCDVYLPVGDNANWPIKHITSY